MKSSSGVTLVCALSMLSPWAMAGDGYLRVGAGTETSAAARFADVDCAQAAPPALFGCVEGVDGRPIGAYGDFGNGLAGELGIGHRFSSRLRGELLLDWRPGLAFEGDANFTGVAGEQPVAADVDSRAVFAVGYLDFPVAGRWQPYVGLGVGAARNRLDPVEYGFPGLAPGAITRTRGGSDTGFAWMATAGIAVALDAQWQLDLGLRYSDLGEVRSDAGPATIVRTSGEHDIVVGATHASLAARGIFASLRRGF